MADVTHQQPFDPPPHGSHPAPADPDPAPSGPATTPDPASAADAPYEGAAIAARLDRIEALLTPAHGGSVPREPRVVPAWRRVTPGETRWASTLSVIVVVIIQYRLPARVTGHPKALMPVVEAALMVCLFALNPHRIERRSRVYRLLGLALTLAIGGSNMYSVIRLVHGLVTGTDHASAGELLLTGGEIWLINVVIFALAYWELDRGGPAARAFAEQDTPDFLFPLMQSPELAPRHWEPRYVDYFYLSFTNATAFSPTDVLPVTAKAKLFMLAQSAVSLITVVLVVARAVNILG